MDSLLYQIYSGEYDFTPEWDKRQQELDQKIYAEWDKVQRMFGDKFTDHLFELEGEREEIREFRCFQEGFRLGVRLMVEVFTSATG